MVLTLLVAAAQLATQDPVRTCKPGDAILLSVRNEPTLTDTFAVSPQLNVVLPGIGAVSVAGVPRDSIAPHLERELARFLRHPSVQARVMVRVAVVGEVARPGFYRMPLDVALSDALMVAGGPTKDAKVEDITVQRDQRKFLDAAATRSAFAGGATVDAAAIESGDMITVPRLKPRDTETIVRIVAMLVTIPLAVLTISRAR